MNWILDIVVITLFIGFNFLIWFYRKDKRIQKNFEIVFRGITPISIAFGWYYLNYSYLIFVIIPISVILFYIFNFSEFFLMNNFVTMGNKLIVLNFFEQEPIYNELNVYVDSSQKKIDISQLLLENIAKKGNEELEEYLKLVESLKPFRLRILYFSLCDFVKDDFLRYVCLYWVSPMKIDENKDKDIIPKVLSLNCVKLENEEIKKRNFNVILGIEGQRDEELLKNLQKLAFVLENIKILPKYYEFELMRDEIKAKDETIKELRKALKEIYDFKGVINTELQKYKKKE